jgi:hypothetical protein
MVSLHEQRFIGLWNQGSGKFAGKWHLLYWRFSISFAFLFIVARTSVSLENVAVIGDQSRLKY